MKPEDPRLSSLKVHLGKDLLNTLKQPNVVEIMLNPDGQLWVEAIGSPMKVFGKMTSNQAILIMKTIAGFHDQVINANTPILECEFPIDGSRFEGLIAPVVNSPVFTIRKRPESIFTLTDYRNHNIITEQQERQLIEAITSRKNILVVGGTGSGKTTFCNALIHAISIYDADSRIVMIEDTQELQCSAPNVVSLRSNATTSMNKLLRATLRLRPDRILVGEVRGGEALTLLKAWNTGHPGGLATIHADSAALGLDRLEECISEATPTVNRKLIAQAVNVIVFIQKTKDGRRIKEILRVIGLDGKDYITEPL